MKIEIEAATVINTGGSDKLILYVKGYKEAVYPYTSQLTLHCEAARGTGAEFVRNNFCIEPKVIG